MGTAALPALVITSVFGMNIQYPEWTKSPWTFWSIMLFSLLLTGFLLRFLKRADYLPGGSTSQPGASPLDDGPTDGQRSRRDSARSRR